MKLKNQDGFTLIELLIAFIVIGIIAAISITGYSNMRTAATTTGMPATLFVLCKG